MPRKIRHSYRIVLRGVSFSDGAPWTYHCRAFDSEGAKLIAAKFYQEHRTPMNRKPRTLISLIRKMNASRFGKD